MAEIPEGFELLFLTEGPDADPAAEIQFGGQRLCVLREDALGSTEIEFVADKYILEQEVVMKFPLESFTCSVEIAKRELHAWHVNLKAENAQQSVQPDRREDAAPG